VCVRDVVSHFDHAVSGTRRESLQGQGVFRHRVYAIDVAVPELREKGRGKEPLEFNRIECPLVFARALEGMCFGPQVALHFRYVLAGGLIRRYGSGSKLFVSAFGLRSGSYRNSAYRLSVFIFILDLCVVERRRSENKKIDDLIEVPRINGPAHATCEAELSV
jgi:hypothetical protein